MPKNSNLDNVSIVLVDTKTPANIGATARCMMNMGLSRLVLVRPPRDPLQEAAKLAAGAEKILERAEVHGELTEALANESLVLGASRHTGRLRKNIRTPRQSATGILHVLRSNRVSVVFGNEVNGLTNEELALCHEIIAIPSSDAFPSLNLSHAVLVVAYELFAAAHAPAAPGPELAAHQDMEQFYAHLQDTLRGIGFLSSADSGRMMFSLRQIFGRARLQPRDVRILRGILSNINRKCRE